MVSDIESLVEENLQDELFKQGISDSQVYDLHRAEQALFSSSCSPWLPCELVWDQLPFLYRCAADIAPGAVACQIEVVSLSLAFLIAVGFCCDTLQSSCTLCSPLQLSNTVRAFLCLAMQATIGGLTDGSTMFLVRETALRQREIMKAVRWSL